MFDRKLSKEFIQSECYELMFHPDMTTNINATLTMTG